MVAGIRKKPPAIIIVPRVAHVYQSVSLYGSRYKKETPCHNYNNGSPKSGACPFLKFFIDIHCMCIYTGVSSL